MNRPRLAPPRRRARRTPPPSAPFPFDPATDAEPAWLEIGRGEVRVFRDGGDLAWSAALPDGAPALAGREWTGGELAALHEGADPGADDDADDADEEKRLLGRS